MSRPPRVVMVSAGFWPAIGGAERQALELSRALAARGAAVRVLTRRVGGAAARESVHGVPVRRLAVLPGPLDAPGFLAAAFLWLWSHGDEFDAIHAHLAGSPALAAALAGRVLGKPVVIKLGGGRGIGELAASRATLFGRLKLAALAALAPKFLAVARDLAEEAREILGPVEVEVLPNAVDTARFAPVSPERRRSLRRALAWGSETVFLYAGRLSPEKRLPWFVERWTRACAGLPAALVLVGEGPEGPALREAAAKSGGRVFVLPPREDLADLYAAADAFVLPSVSEGLSNALLEAMSSGLAPLASRVGGTPEAVEDGRTGLLFDRDDAAAAEAAARRLAAEPGLAARLGAAAREDARARYDLARACARLEALYRGEA